MARMPWPAAMPREISSRSTKLSTLGERRLMGGEIPPLDPSPRRTAELPRSSALPMPRIDSPALYMRQSSAHWESVNNRRRPPLMHHPLFVRLQPGCFADRLRPPTLSPHRGEGVMPWKECSVMDERLQFVAPPVARETRGGLCKEFGMSRTTRD